MKNDDITDKSIIQNPDNNVSSSFDLFYINFNYPLTNDLKSLFFIFMFISILYKIRSFFPLVNT